MARRAALGTLAVVVLAAVIACSADPACALGTRGWCENAMAALAVHSAAAQGAGTIVIVAQGFTVDPARYETAVSALKPDALGNYIAARAASPDSLLVVISNIQITNSPGYGSEGALGVATVSVYRGATLLRTETVHGKLVGSTWMLG